MGVTYLETQKFTDAINAWQSDYIMQIKKE